MKGEAMHEGPEKGASADAFQLAQDRRHHLRLALVAEKCPDLLPLLESANGALVGGAYRLEKLLAVGGQFFVWLAAETATGRTVVLKQTRFDYRRPVRYGLAETERLRQMIRKEYEVLRADR